MKAFLFALVMLFVVLFSSQAFGEEQKTLYYCPDGNYYTEPCRPYYFEPGVTTGMIFYAGCRYYYPVYPNCPFRYQPRFLHHWGPENRQGMGHGRGYYEGGRLHYSGHMGGGGRR